MVPVIKRHPGASLWVSVSVIPRPIVLWRGVTPLIAARRKARRAAAIVVAMAVEVIVIEIMARAASILVTLVMSIVVKVVVAEIAAEVAARVTVLLVAVMIVEVVKSSIGLSERWHGEGARWHRSLRSWLIKAATVDAWIGHAEATVRGGRLAEAEYQTCQHR